MKKERLLEIVWFVVVIVLFVFSIKIVKSGELQSQIASFGILAPLVIIFLKASTLIIAPLGGAPLYLIAGALFGGPVGFLISFLGDVIGSLTCFFISRKYGSKLVKFLVGERFWLEIQKFVMLLENNSSFIKARLALFSIPELFAYSAGLSRVGFVKFITIHSIFMLPLSVAGVFFGSSMPGLISDYPILALLLPLIIAVFGFIMLWKDYQRIEYM